MVNILLTVNILQNQYELILWLPKTSHVFASLTFFPRLSYGPGMRTIALPVLSTLLGLLRSRTLLNLDILALRQQLAMVNQTPRKRLRFHWGQRLFWVWLYRVGVELTIMPRVAAGPTHGNASAIGNH
jgi:hypothetical protein